VETIRRLLPAMFENLPLYPEQASTMAQPVDVLYLVWWALSALFSSLIFGGMLFMGVRYRRRRASQVGAADTHAPMVEMLSMSIPFVIAMAMFAWGARVYVDLRRPPQNAVEYLAFGKQWMWKYQHPSGLREINNLTVPVDTPIKMTLTSEDVIHSFFVPAFRVKQDVVPGRYTSVWFEATKVGRYHMFCAEYCGTEHSMMGGYVDVVDQDDYDVFLRREGSPTQTPASSGEQLFTSLACVNCHVGEDSPRGPSLHGLFGEAVQMASGEQVRADETYLRESILVPQAKLVAGYPVLMPTFQGQVTEEQLADLIQYIKELGSSTGLPARTRDPAVADGPATVASGG
jgi:cytochrome c oxidase subunit 2